MKVEQVIIIGAGPAGIAAALQLVRYHITPLVFECDSIGGLLRNADLVENYPGFPKGVSGSKLIGLFNAQFKNAFLQTVREDVVNVDFGSGVFTVKTAEKTYQSQTLVIASGTKPRKFTDLVIPSDLRDKVFYEVYPLLDLKDNTIAIIGGGDAAFDFAINLSKQNHVIILNRSSVLKCLPLLWERTQQKETIQYLENSVVKKLHPANKGRMIIDFEEPGGEKKLEIDCLVGAIGREPNLDFLGGSISTKMKALQSQGLLSLIGDVKNKIYRQTSIAVGDGVMAAMQIAKFLLEKRT